MTELTIGHRMPDNVGFGSLLRRMRGDTTVSSLAMMAGISAGYVRSIERGTRAPGIDVAKRLLSSCGIAFNATDDALMFDYDNVGYEISFRYAAVDPDSFGPLVRRLADMNPVQLRAIDAFIDFLESLPEE